MKKSLLLIGLYLGGVAVSATENEKKVTSNIKEVTVFLSGAEVSSQANTNLPAGTSEVVFEGLSPYINSNSIQVKGEGDFILLGVQFRTNHLNQQAKSKEIINLEDSLESLQSRLELLRSQRGVFESEESFLLANKNIGGSNVGVSATELEKIATILRIRLNDIKSKLLDIKKNEKKIGENITRVNNQLQELNAKRNRTTGEIVVSLTSKAGGTAKFQISYLVQNAGWIPLYDIRAVDSKSPVSLNFRANVYQSSGEDWKNVRLSLSTGNPSLSGTQPVLHPWWLNFQQANSYDSYRGKVARKESAAPAAAAMAEDAYLEKKSKPMESVASYTTIQENPTNYEYAISIPYTVISGGKETSVEVQSLSLPATYKYYCAPRLDKDAFLLAKIVNWDQYNLLAGEANIYFEGTYVGKSYINPYSTSDTLDVSLGRDKSVIVTRDLLRDFSEKKVIGMNKKESFLYEISVRNKKKQEIEMIIEDQIPLTRSSEIEVSVLEISGAKHNKETGKLTWEIQLNPSETKKIRLGYQLKYPKEKVISNL